MFFLFYIHFFFFFFFFNATATTEIYTLSLHDALPISCVHADPAGDWPAAVLALDAEFEIAGAHGSRRSEEHTSELQSHVNLVCRLLLEKKKKNKIINRIIKKIKKTKKKNT